MKLFSFTNMHTNKKAWLVLAILTIPIKLFSFCPFAVEKYYSTGLYPIISRLLRFLFGWIPFSLGDVLYLLAGIWLVIQTIRFFAAIFKRRANKIFWWHVLRGIVFYSLLVYTAF